MSFSADVKRELCELVPQKACCRKAELYGMLEGGRSFSAANISLQTELCEVASLYTSLLHEFTGIIPWVADPVGENSKFSTLLVPAEDCQRVGDVFGHNMSAYAMRLNRANFDCEECAAAYLRGIFLTCGAMTTPQIGYHLEFTFPYYHLTGDLKALFAECGLTAREVRRKGHYVLYFKESEQIEDCLTLMGAMNASLELMNIKMIKDIRNNANRIANCENANIDKTVAASSKQVAAIRLVADTCGLDALSEDLRELAALRLENPDMSLRELGVALTPPLSRSGVNHRLERIMEFAEKLSK